MPALAMLAPAPMSRARRIGMTGMWVYLAVAMAAVVLRIVAGGDGSLTGRRPYGRTAPVTSQRELRARSVRVANLASIQAA